ncbi:MAG: hypothetical protein IKD77_00890 [Bacilli bacterium]|nr:hypothetical protein [Bacilli bacterium]
MKKKILVSSIFIALFILLFVSQTAFATETGIINFTAIDSDGHEVNNLEVKIYKVASYEDSNMIAVEKFKEFNIEDASDENISKIQKYSSEEVDAFLTQTTNDKGEFTLSNVEARKIFVSSK